MYFLQYNQYQPHNDDIQEEEEDAARKENDDHTTTTQIKKSTTVTTTQTEEILSVQRGYRQGYRKSENANILDSNVSNTPRTKRDRERNELLVQDGTPLVLLMKACSGSTATFQTSKKILKAHGVKFIVAHWELYKPHRNYRYKDAKIKLINELQDRLPPEMGEEELWKFDSEPAMDSLTTNLYDDSFVKVEDVLIESMRMMIEDAKQVNRVLFFKNERHGLTSRLKEELGATFGHVVRRNVLDRAICMARDCFNGLDSNNDNTTGYPVMVFPNSDTINTAGGDATPPTIQHTNLCFKRREFLKNQTIKEMGIKIKAKFDNPRKLHSWMMKREAHTEREIQAYESVRHKPVRRNLRTAQQDESEEGTGTTQYYEDLFAFEYTPDENVFNECVDRWRVLVEEIIGHRFEIDPTIVARTIRPMQNTLRAPGSHEAVIQNFAQVSAELSKYDPPLDHHIRYSSTNYSLSSLTSKLESSASTALSKSPSKGNKTPIQLTLDSSDSDYRPIVWGFDQLLLDLAHNRSEEDLARLSARNLTLTGSPYKSAILCACAKCGSTSLYSYIYKHIFGVDYLVEYKETKPHLQDVRSYRWDGVINTTWMGDKDLVNLFDGNHETKKDVFSFALIRDPVDRLISAWKSKVACDSNTWRTNKKDRKRYVPHLLELSGGLSSLSEESGITQDDGVEFAEDEVGGMCLSFSMYLKVLQKIHRSGKARRLNVHFLPQDQHCFRHVKPSDWSFVSTPSNPLLYDTISTAFGFGYTNAVAANHTQKRLHSSGKGILDISDDDRKILEEITQSERRLLEEYYYTTPTEEKQSA